MIEKHYAFIKDDRVVNIALFENEDKELADRICKEQGYDLAIWLGDTQPVPHLYASYKDGKIQEITHDDYYAVGLYPMSYEEHLEELKKPLDPLSGKAIALAAEEAAKAE